MENSVIYEREGGVGHKTDDSLIRSRRGSKTLRTGCASALPILRGWGDVLIGPSASFGLYLGGNTAKMPHGTDCSYSLANPIQTPALNESSLLFRLPPFRHPLVTPARPWGAGGDSGNHVSSADGLGGRDSAPGVYRDRKSHFKRL